MTLPPTFLAGPNLVMHAAGWLEGGLVSCYEKFIVDIELLRMLAVEFTPLEISPESLAFGAHEEVGHGGHFLGAEHTMERFRTCFYRPLLSSTVTVIVCGALAGHVREIVAQRGWPVDWSGWRSAGILP
jgi:trimethylamine---corrinoid protein Co-methyltransferase